MTKLGVTILIAGLLTLAGCGAGEKVVTMAKYERLHPGMSYPEVAEVIGAQGKELSSLDSGGTFTVMYGWSNDDGSNMSVMFQHNKMISKAQAGLE